MIEFKTYKRRFINEKSWEDLTARATFYHTLPWIDICIKGLPGEALFLCGYEDDKLICGMPVILFRKMGMQSFYSMPNGTYGGIIWSPDVTRDDKEQFIKQLSQYLIENSFSRSVIADYTFSLNMLRKPRMKRKTYFTHTISLQNKDYSPPKKVMIEIKTGEKSGGIIGKVFDENDIDDFYKLYISNEIRHGRTKPLYDKKFFYAIYGILKDSNRLYWNKLTVNDRMIGSQIHFIFNRTMHYWMAISENDKRTYRIDYRLLHDAIMRGIDNTVSLVNLGASPPDAKGLVFFKERWGGVKFEYPILSAKSGLRKLIER